MRPWQMIGLEPLPGIVPMATMERPVEADLPETAPDFGFSPETQAVLMLKRAEIQQRAAKVTERPGSNLERFLRSCANTTPYPGEQWKHRTVCANYRAGGCAVKEGICPISSMSAPCDSFRFPATEAEIQFVLDDREQTIQKVTV